MRAHRRLITFTMVFATAAVIGCDDQANLMEPDGEGPGVMIAQAPPDGKGPKEEIAGNNLSYPVIWAEGVTKTLPGTPGMTPVLDGEWWYQWGTNGTDPDVTPASCPPDPEEGDASLNPENHPLCDDGIPGSVDLIDHIAGGIPADNPLPLARAFIQKDMNNTWQAESADWSAAPVNVHWIDWGDNLESVDWYTRSQVRTEVVLFQDLLDPMLEYEMRHTDGWGINEVHGLAATRPGVPLLGPGTRATLYSHCARLTIQLLLVSREDSRLADLVWVPEMGWTEPDFDPDNPSEPYPDDLINDVHIFNGSVHTGGDGPGYYSAEINVKGRIIYGYTWNVRNLHDDTLDPDGAGDYRITFSFDEGSSEGGSCPVDLNTFFQEGVTEIMVPLEVETEAIAEAEGEEPGGGAVGVLRTDHNLTYMDVRILRKSGGKK